MLDFGEWRQWSLCVLRCDLVIICACRTVSFYTKLFHSHSLQHEKGTEYKRANKASFKSCTDEMDDLNHELK